MEIDSIHGKKVSDSTGRLYLRHHFSRGGAVTRSASLAVRYIGSSLCVEPRYCFQSLGGKTLKTRKDLFVRHLDKATSSSHSQVVDHHFSRQSPTVLRVVSTVVATVTASILMIISQIRGVVCGWLTAAVFCCASRPVVLTGSTINKQELIA